MGILEELAKEVTTETVGLRNTDFDKLKRSSQKMDLDVERKQAASLWNSVKKIVKKHPWATGGGAAAVAGTGAALPFMLGDDEEEEIPDEVAVKLLRNLIRNRGVKRSSVEEDKMKKISPKTKEDEGMDVGGALSSAYEKTAPTVLGILGLIAAGKFGRSKVFRPVKKWFGRRAASPGLSSLKSFSKYRSDLASGKIKDIASKRNAFKKVLTEADDLYSRGQFDPNDYFNILEQYKSLGTGASAGDIFGSIKGFAKRNPGTAAGIGAGTAGLSGWLANELRKKDNQENRHGAIIL